MCETMKIAGIHLRAELVCRLVTFLVGLGSVPALSQETLEARVGEVVPYTLTITNAQSGTMLLTGYESSCPCLTLEEYPREVPAGESMPIQVQIAPDRPGEYRYELVVATAHPDQPEVAYSIDVHVQEGGERTLLRRDSRIRDILKTRPRDRDRSLYRSVQYVRSTLQDESRMMLIDVRRKALYLGTHVPGAVNMELWTLKARRYLKNRSVVLIDEGHGSAYCEEVCVELRNSGFRSIHILQGGMNKWVASGGPVEGTGHGRRELTRINPAAFLASQDYKDWLVLDAGTAATTEHSLEGLNRVVNANGVKARLQEAMPAAYVEPDFRRVLIVDQDGEGYAGYETRLGDLDHAVVFYLEKGQLGLEKQLHDMVAIENRSRASVQGPGAGYEPIVTRPKCSTCP